MTSLEPEYPQTLAPICDSIKKLAEHHAKRMLAAAQAYDGNLSSINETFQQMSDSSDQVPVKHGWFEVVIPIISFLGIIGNVLNLLVLTRRRMLSSMDRLEKSATYGLVALAVSDMFFCLSVFPHTFINEESYVVEKQYVLIYKLHGIALVNLFLMVSTWLIVTMSINRYIVVVYPLHARSTLSTFRTTVSIILVYFLSTIITLPFFIHIKVSECTDYNGNSLYEFKTPFTKKVHNYLLFYMQWIWPIVADFIPIGILAFCNTRLIWELKRATTKRKRTAHGQTVRDSSQKVTLTLVIIVLMLLFLVSPSEILRYINPYKSWGHAGHVIASITNVLQALNFAVNFILYCVVSPTFRHTFKGMFSRCLRDKADKTEMQSMLHRGTHTHMDRTITSDTEID